MIGRLFTPFSEGLPPGGERARLAHNWSSQGSIEEAKPTCAATVQGPLPIIPQAVGDLLQALPLGSAGGGLDGVCGRAGEQPKEGRLAPRTLLHLAKHPARLEGGGLEGRTCCFSCATKTPHLLLHAKGGACKN